MKLKTIYVLSLFLYVVGFSILFVCLFDISVITDKLYIELAFNF